jgi:hypothetical protein
VAALEKPKESRSWLMPIIVVAALVLVGLAAIGIYATQNKGANGGQNTISQSNNSGGDNTTPGSQATPGGDKSVGSNLPTPTALPANASDEDKVREVIRRSNDMQIKAWEDLNTDILSDYYTDQALADNVDMVKQLRDRNMTAKPRYQKLDILDVSVSGNTATAHTIEVWTVIFTNKTDMRPNVTGPDTLKETYHLVKKGDKWYVSKLEIATPVPATATPSGT